MGLRLTPLLPTPATYGWYEGSGLSLTTYGQMSEYGTPGGEEGPVLDIHLLDMEIERQRDLDVGITPDLAFGGAVKFLDEYNAAIDRQWSGLAGLRTLWEGRVELIEEVTPDPDVWEYGASVVLLRDFTASISTSAIVGVLALTRAWEGDVGITRVVELDVAIEYKIVREAEA